MYYEEVDDYIDSRLIIDYYKLLLILLEGLMAPDPTIG